MHVRNYNCKQNNKYAHVGYLEKYKKLHSSNATELDKFHFRHTRPATAPDPFSSSDSLGVAPLEEVLMSLGMVDHTSEVESIIASADHDHKGRIDYHQYLTLCGDSDSVMSSVRWIFIFTRFEYFFLHRRSFFHCKFKLKQIVKGQREGLLGSRQMDFMTGVSQYRRRRILDAMIEILRATEIDPNLHQIIQTMIILREKFLEEIIIMHQN